MPCLVGISTYDLYSNPLTYYCLRKSKLSLQGKIGVLHVSIFNDMCIAGSCSATKYSNRATRFAKIWHFTDTLITNIELYVQSAHNISIHKD